MLNPHKVYFQFFIYIKNKIKKKVCGCYLRSNYFGAQKCARSEPSSHFLLSVLPICQSLCAFQDTEATEGKKTAGSKDRSS